MNGRATYMVHTRTYNVLTCTYVVHRFYIWYAYTTMVCSAVLWHELLTGMRYAIRSEVSHFAPAWSSETRDISPY